MFGKDAGRSRHARDRRPARGGPDGRGRANRRDVSETVVLEGSSRRAGAARPSRTQRRLVDLAAEWIGMIVALRQAGQIPDPTALRARAVETKNTLEARAREAGFGAEDTNDAVFALVAFLDETVLSTQGAAREVWISRPFQLELYGQSMAGEEFFVRLERLRKARDSRIEALEVYYTCLALGFAGRYKLGGVERIQALLDEVERDIAAVRRSGGGPLAPNAIRQERGGETVKGGIPVWLTLAAFLPAVMLGWLVIFLFARAGAGGAAAAVRSLLSH